VSSKRLGAGHAGKNAKGNRRRKSFVKRIVYLVVVAVVAMLIVVPTAMAQTEMTVEMETTQPLPKSGGVPIGPSVLLPAAALLVGGGLLGYAVLRRRR
jgi:hypothetical protein